MKKFLMAAAALALVGSVAFAGPNVGGTIIVHNAQLTYPGLGQGFSGCGLGTPPASCESANTEIDGSDNAYWVWKVYAAFAPCSGPRLKAMEFGITYDQAVLVLDHGNCLGDPNNGAAELPGPGWPSSGAGTVLVWQNTQTATLVEAYWFGGYSYYGAPAMFNLGAHPTLGGFFADDSNPPIQDAITGYGSLGFNQPGHAVCPPPTAEGACCVNGNCILTCEADCQGTWMGGSCDPNPCVTTGACCNTATGDCTITTQTDCQFTWLGPNTVCSPETCPIPPVPTKTESWGQIKHQYR